jgi:Beta-propeller repeat
MRFVNTLLFSLSFLFASAQPFNWQWSVYDTATVSGPVVMGFATDALGNTYATGQFFGSVSFGGLAPIASVGQCDVFVVKYDNQGVALWAVRGGGDNFDEAMDLALDGAGNVYFTGYYQSTTATFGSTTLARQGQMDIFVARLDPVDGSFAWAKRFGDANNGIEWGKGIACDASGNVYVTGQFENYLSVPGLTTLESCSQYYNSFLLKLDEEGNGIWSRRPDCGQHWSYSASEGQVVTVGADAMLYFGMRARGDTIFMETDTIPNEQTSGQAHDGVVAKYDLDGNYHWSRGLGGYGYDDVQSIQADADGMLYVAIHREGETTSLSLPGIAVAGNLGIYRSLILKMDPDGGFLWGTRIGNSTYDHDIADMKLESAETLLVGGWHQGNFEIGGITPNPGVTGTYGLYLARFDSSSALTDLYAARHQYPRGIVGIGLDEGANIYVAGYLHDSLSLPGLPVMELADESSSALFVARSGDFNTAVDAAIHVNDGASFYPMPSTGRFTIQSAEPFTELQIVNALGEVVLQETFLSTTRRDVQLETNGAYFCSLWKDGERVASGRAVVQP